MASIKIFIRFVLSLIIVMPEYFRFRPLKFIKRSFGLLSDYIRLKKMPDNKTFSNQLPSVIPELADKTSLTEIEPIYFYQSAWCASKVFKNKPERHYDIGSSVNMLGIISQFVPVTMVDIRPPNVSIPEMGFTAGTILSLPFKDKSIASLSSICVIEHIGLGRYGDPLDPFGSEKAAAELSRVLAQGGSLYITVPVYAHSKLYFNAHRAFHPKDVKLIFEGLTLREEKYQYGNQVQDLFDASKGFGTGYFHFVKN